MVGVKVAVLVAVIVGVNVDVVVAVNVDVKVGVNVAVWVGVPVDVAVSIMIGVDDGVAVAVSVLIGVDDGVAVDVGFPKISCGVQFSRETLKFVAPSGASINALSSGETRSIVCDWPGSRNVERQTSVPRCHSMISVVPVTAVTSHPSAHEPMYGYNAWLPAAEYTLRELSPVRALF